MRLPYTTASVQEVQRLANILPLNLMHQTTKDVVISGRKIIGRTTVIPQIGAVHEDEKYFKNAKEFMPERFVEDPKLAEKVRFIMI